jgi:hypothetical protein
MRSKEQGLRHYIGTLTRFRRVGLRINRPLKKRMSIGAWRKRQWKLYGA